MFLKDLEKRMEAWDTNKTLVADLFKGLVPYPTPPSLSLASHF
jgi:hypothetical protein